MTVEFVGEAVLRRFPLLVWRRQQEYTNDLLREFQLMTTASEHDPQSTPRRLLEAAALFIKRYDTYSADLTAQREGALRAGLVTIDSLVPLPAQTPKLIQAVRPLLEDVQEFARRGELLTLPAPPDVVALREWTMDEMLRQYAGEEPHPWTGSID